MRDPRSPETPPEHKIGTPVALSTSCLLYTASRTSSYKSSQRVKPT